MVQRTVLVLEDDVDGGDAAETVQFALDGASYEIDLNDENAAKLRDSLAVWIGHARRAGSSRRRGRPATGAASGRRSRSEGADMRAWARDNGYQVSSRGRVSEEIRSAYAAAHA